MTVIKFGATWCNPCRMLAPIIAQSAGRNPEAVYMDVDVDEDPEVVVAWGISGVPTVVVLDAEGLEIERAVGPGTAALVKRL